MQSSTSATGALGLISTADFVSPAPPSGPPFPSSTDQPTLPPILESSVHDATAQAPQAHDLHSTSVTAHEPPSDLHPVAPAGPSEPTQTPSTLVRPIISTEPPSSPSITPLPSLSQSTASLNSHSMTTRTKDRTLKPCHFSDFVALHSTSDVEPTSFTQAVKSSHWRTAMVAKIDALASNCTWSLVPAPPNRPVIGSKWVYKIKRNSYGSIERYKARLVAKGYNQQQGIDFEETYSPVVRATTIRVVLSLAVSAHWPLKQLDVSNAFLNGDLHETVYMAQPQGFIDQSYPNHVCLLHKSLYGFKQAPRAWFAKLNQTLL